MQETFCALVLGCLSVLGSVEAYLGQGLFRLLLLPLGQLLRLHVRVLVLTRKEMIRQSRAYLQASGSPVQGRFRGNAR